MELKAVISDRRHKKIDIKFNWRHNFAFSQPLWGFRCQLLWPVTLPDFVDFGPLVMHDQQIDWISTVNLIFHCSPHVTKVILALMLGPGWERAFVLLGLLNSLCHILWSNYHDYRHPAQEFYVHLDWIWGITMTRAGWDAYLSPTFCGVSFWSIGVVGALKSFGLWKCCWSRVLYHFDWFGLGCDLWCRGWNFAYGQIVEDLRCWKKFGHVAFGLPEEPQTWAKMWSNLLTAKRSTKCPRPDHLWHGTGDGIWPKPLALWCVMLSKNNWSGLGHMVVMPVHDMTKSSKFYKILTLSRLQQVVSSCVVSLTDCQIYAWCSHVVVFT